MKKLIWVCTLMFIFFVIAGCGSSAPPQKTEVNITPPAVNVTPPAVNVVNPPAAPKVEVNITPPAPQNPPKK